MLGQSLRALVIDDEEGIRRFVGETLRRVNYDVVAAANGEEALELLRDAAFDVAVVDLNLGGRVDGLRVLEALRWRWPATAAIILTAHGSLDSAIAAIEEEVDGYLLKPVKPPEIREAIERALERRRKLRQRLTVEEKTLIQRGAFTIDTQQHLATRDGHEMHLTPQEFELLAHMARNASRVIPAPELVRVVRGCEIEDRAEATKIIKWYIHRLRQETEPDPSRPRHIVTVRGVGYRFQE